MGFREIIRKDPLLQLEVEKNKLLKELKKIAKWLSDEKGRKEIEEYIKDFENRWIRNTGLYDKNWEIIQKRELLEELLREVSKKEEMLSKSSLSPFFYKRIVGKVKEVGGKAKRGIDWLGEARPEATSYAFRLLPIIIGVTISVVLFWVFFPNTFLLAGSLSLSVALAIPKTETLGLVRAMLVFSSIIFLWFGISAFNPFIALIFIFIGYAMLSPRITSEEYHVYETTLIFLRIILGIIIAFSPFFVFFKETFDLLALALTLIGVGFFVLAFPEQEERAERGVIKIIIEKCQEYGNVLAFFSGIFVFVGVALGLSQLIGSFGWLAFQTIFFGILGFTAIATAFSVKGHHRGEAGFPLYLLLLFTVTTSYPDILGEAVFGHWWPQISSTLQTITEPISISISQLQQGMSDIWLMFTCPQCYYEEQLKKYQTQSQPEGSIYSVEVTEFKLFSTHLDPAQRLTGTIIFENKGENEAKDFKVTLLNPKIYIKSSARKYEYVEIKDNDIAQIMSCTGTVSGTTCEKRTLYPGEKVQISFYYGKQGSAPWSVNVIDKKGNILGQLDQCECIREKGENFECENGIGSCSYNKCNKNETYEKDAILSVEGTVSCSCPSVEQIKKENNLGENTECKVYCDISTQKCTYICTLKCNPETDHLIYKFGSKPVKIGFNYSFRYTTNVSLQVLAMEENLFNKLMGEGKIIQRSVISSYTGGPVKASIWTELEPIICGKKAFMSFTIMNEGTGKVLRGTTFKIRLPEEIKIEPEIGQKIKADCSKNYNNNNNWLISCTVTKDIPKGEIARVTFWVTPTCGNAEQKTLTVVGYVDYIYGDEEWKTIKILPAPLT